MALISRKLHLFIFLDELDKTVLTRRIGLLAEREEHVLHMSRDK